VTRAIVVLFAAALAAPCGAAVVELALAPGAAPGALHGSPAMSWSLGSTGLPGAAGLAGPTLAPALRALELKGWTPESFSAQPPALQAVAGAEAARSVRAEAATDVPRLLAAAAAADPAAPEFPVLAAQLAQLAGPLSDHVPEEARADVRAAADAALAKLAGDERAALLAAVARMSRILVEGSRPEPTPVEAAVAALPNPPARLMTPGVARLRAAGDAARLSAPAPAASGPAFRAKVAWLSARFALRAAIARHIYRPLLDAGRAVLTHVGALYRKYLTGRDPDKHAWRWSVVEGLYEEGDFRGSFGHPVYDGQPEIMSGLIFAEKRLAALSAQRHSLRGVEISPMLGVSGMSFPQLSAQSHLSLLYIHLRLAKELGVRTLENTGEGGPGLLLALLEGDAKKAERFIISWDEAHGQFAPGSWSEAKVAQFVETLMKKRDALFADFTPEDLRRAQIVAQFGSGLNGIRRDDAEGRVDFDKLRRVADSPYVAMIQYKLKQAAKRGAKVDARKIDDVVAAWRELPRGGHFKSPEVIPEMESAAAVAALIKATRAVTSKPVSLKFGVGDARDLYEFLRFLRDADALPDHLQLDGRGDDFSPGSGNAPPGANTSLPAREAVVVVDAVLKKLGVRERVFVDSTGDLLLPAEAVEALALGADGVCAARGWMGIGLGCAMVRACANGSCPYGIAARSNSFVGLSLDPESVGPRGFAAAASWYRTFVQTLAEAGLDDWRAARGALGLGTGSTTVRVKEGPRTVPLDRRFSPDYVADLLRGVLTRDEVDRLVFGRRQ
jgi:glutamate synthase domain-containing protein 2